MLLIDSYFYVRNVIYAAMEFDAIVILNILF